jgi:iron complex outermembrane recepter protein
MRKHALILGAAVGAFLAPSAHAQQSDSSVTASEEIVVTAERRESTAQRTALSIAAFGAQELEDRGVTSPQDLVSVVPGIKVTNGTINLNFSMRGVGTSQSGPLGLGGVAAYVDGIYMNRPLTSGMIFDLNRIEVLAGPQGTLYGRGATAGAINFVHNRPTDELGGRAQVTIGNYEALRTELTVNVPINDWLSARASYQRSQRDGYYSNGYQNQDNYSSNIQLLATPTERLSILFSYLEDQSDETGSGQVRAGAFTGDPYKNNTNALGRIDQHREHYMVQADYDAGPVTLTYLGALSSAPIRQTRWVNNGNITSIEVNDTWNQHELRATSNGDGRFQWTTGLFYLLIDQDYHSLNNVTLGEQFTPFIQNESIALYGQGTYSFTDAWRLTAGLRFSRDDTELRGSLFQPTPAPVTVGPFSSATSSEATNWKLGLEWDVADQSLLYLNVGDGYRPGGINQVPPPNVYEPETVMHYELGSKNRFGGGRLQLNGAVFYDAYENYFQGAVAPVPGFPTVRSFQVTNAGEATIKGATIDLIAAISDSDTLGISVNLLDARFDRFIVGAINYAGDALPNSPEVTFNIGYEHEWRLPGGAQITGRLDHYYSSPFALVFNRLPNVEQDAFGRTDVRLEYESAEGGFNIALFGKNLEDERVLNYVGVGVPPVNPIFQSFDPPQTYGLSIGVRY